jgi:NAD(P)-dependent dehydrogenase (short-subunit alcohol dehydrogenase family)
MSDRLAGKRALVVGASRGIGRGIVRAYVEEGAEVALASRSINDLERIAAELGEDAIAVECDVRETDSVEAAVDTAVEAFGGLDVVVNSAGVIVRDEMTATTDSDLEFVTEVNFEGMMRVARAALPELLASEGTFVIVSSQLGEVGVQGASAYCATKGGINNLARQLAVEYGDRGVTVNALAPGIIKTEMNSDVREEDPGWESRKAANVPLGRLGEVEDVTGPAVFLASDESSYLNGHVLVVDGGYIAQ